MSAQTVPHEKSLVDVLATWGASALPGAPELFDVLASLAQTGRVATLRRVLQEEAVRLEPRLTEQLRALLLAAGDGAAGPGFERSVDETFREVEQAVELRWRDQLGALQVDLQPWARLLEPDDRATILDRLWRAGEAEELEERAGALRALAEGREQVRRAAERISTRVGEAAAAPNIDPAVAEVCRAAAGSGAPDRLAEALGRLRTVEADRERVQQRKELVAIRERLQQTCAAARAALDDPNADLSPLSADLLRSAVASAESVAAEETPGDGPDLLSALELWNRTLTAMLEQGPGRDGPPRRHAELGVAVRARVEALVGEDESVRDEARSIGGAVEQAAETGDAAFYQALAQALAWIETRRQAVGQAREVAASELRNASRGLTRTLESHAAVLPTERVVRARLLVEEAEATVAGGAPAALRSLQAEVDRTKDELGELAERCEALRGSREAAERRRVLDELERAGRLADGSSAKRIDAMKAKVDKSRGRELEGAAAEARRLCSSVANATRLAAAKLIRRAGTNTDGDDTLDRFKAALDEDDLDTVHELTARVRERVGADRGRMLWIGVAAVVIVGAIAAFLFVGGEGTATKAYTFAWRDGAAPAGQVTLKLVQGDRVVEERTFDAAAPPSVKLPAGRYEIWINERYTGRVLDAPDDNSPVADLAVPR